MARIRLTMSHASSGLSLTREFEAGAELAANVGSTLGLGSIVSSNAGIGTVPVNATFKKSFLWDLSAALPTGWVRSQIRVGGQLRRCGLLVWGQSNQSGRGNTAEARAIVNATRIRPNTYPYDENPDGPGPPNVVGPALPMADYLLSRPDFPFDRVTIYCTATGNQTIADLYGTDGTNGNFATQAGDGDVLGGPIGSLTPCMLRPGDQYIVIAGPGEADASSGVTTGWAAAWTELKDYILGTYLAGAECLGIALAVLAPTAAGGATQPRQDIVIAEQMSLNNPTANIPIFSVPYLDSDREPTDLIHYSSTGQERWAAEACSRFAARWGW